MTFEFADMIEEHGITVRYEKINSNIGRGKPNNVKDTGECLMLIYPASPAEIKMYAGGEYITEGFNVKTLKKVKLKEKDKVLYMGGKYTVFYVKNYNHMADFYEYLVKKDVGKNG